MDDWFRPDLSDVLDACERGIAEAEALATQAHAPTGPDALTETELHRVLADGLTNAGIPVVREVRFPADPGGTVHPRDRERCDLVALPTGAAAVFDPVIERAEREAGLDTLFEDRVDSIASVARPPDVCDPSDAAWVEVKSTGTFVYRDGVPTPNRSYTDELIRGALADGIKLADAPGLGERAVLLVVFTCDEDAIRRDLITVAHRLLDHGIETRTPIVRSVPISDRAGNTHGVLGLFDVLATSKPSNEVR
ncbi:MAG: hypothetical protein AAGI53_08570 [Planctomycetota bacterium]